MPDEPQNTPQDAPSGPQDAPQPLDAQPAADTPNRPQNTPQDAQDDALDTGPDEHDGAQPDDPSDDTQDEQPAAARASREAARYRTQVRQLETQVHALQAAEIRRLAAEQLNNPDDLAAFAGTDHTDLLADDGTVDPGRVAQLVQELVRERPYLGKHYRPGPDIGALHSGTQGLAPATAGGSWAKAFQQTRDN